MAEPAPAAASRVARGAMAAALAVIAVHNTVAKNYYQVCTDGGPMPTTELDGFTFACGDTVDSLTVAYRTYGDYTGSNAVLVCHALTGSQHVRGRADGDDRGWWPDIVGPGRPIDTTEYFVVCANVPGSCHGTDGPPADGPGGDPWGTAFPPVTVPDWTRCQRRLLDTLGVDRLHAVVGGSVGGMNALDWARRYPDDVHRIAAVATAPRLDAQCLGLNAIARRAIRGDPNWNDGDYYGGAHPDRGLALARQLGHVMYLSKASMADKFGRRTATTDTALPADPAAEFFATRDVESYLDYQADTFVARFDANSYLYLLRAMDAYDLAAGRPSVADALAAFDGDALVLSFTGDWHFTAAQSATVADAFRAGGAAGVAHHVVDSDYGHDAFLVDSAAVGPPLADFLAAGTDGAAVTDATGGV